MIALLLAGGLASSPAPPAVAEAVQRFYAIVVKYHPLGLPTGDVKREMWPLFSARLAGRLALLEACERDYYEGNRGRREGEQLKSGIPWMEYGLFSGGDEKALPVDVRIRRVTPAGVSTRVELEFTYRDTYETYGRPPDDSNTFRWRGFMVLVKEAQHYLVDDYVPVDDDTGKMMAPLSGDFHECRAGRWVGERP
jgi:hypothetical protein